MTELDGLLLVDKPTGCTSHDVVDFVRRKFNLSKVGHCGTLDPLATGLLMIVLGKATKIQDLLMAEDKVYQGTLRFGQTTDSQDSDGKVMEEKEVPPLTLEQIDAAFAKYIGDFYQTPPMVSAVKMNGVPLYKLARQGKTVERQPRLVHIFNYMIGEFHLPELTFEIKCSKGFYVRTYCHDIGQDLGCGAHLTQLRRTRSGNFSVETASTWDSLQNCAGVPDLIPRILSLPDISRLRRQ
jgi:tRNA pseudouridine55 synthase